jgi:AraC-like DNA-binding protein
MRIAKTHIRNWIDYLQAMGVHPATLAELFPYSDSSTDEEGAATISEDEFYNVLRFIHTKLNDELAGIKAGQFLTLKLLGLIYKISLQSKNIGEALHYLSSFLQATFPIVRLQSEDSDETITLRFSIVGGESQLNRLVLENILTIVGREITIMAAEEPMIKKTSPFFHKGYPEDWEHGRDYSLSFQQVLLKAAIRDRGKEQLDILIPQYLQLIESYKPASGFSSKVKLTMLSLADPALPDIKQVAETLYMTPRTLQRKLEEEQSTFRQLKEELKKEIADALLRHESYSVSSVAYVLGYSDAASFNHSYKRWHGSSPKRVKSARFTK